MRNMAVKRDSVRKSFIGDPNGAAAVAAAAGGGAATQPVAEEDAEDGGGDLSAYL